MSSIQWVQFLPATQVICGIISIIFNSFLAFLILTKSPKEIGAYKWLLLYTTFFECVYTFVNFFGGLSVHTYGSAFIAYLDTNNSYFGDQVDEFFIYTYCSCFGFSMALFSAHFIYRYSAMDELFYHKFLRGSKQLVLYIFPIISGGLWGLVCWAFLGETIDKTEYLRQSMHEKYGVNIDQCVYVSARFWLETESGTPYPNLSAFFLFSCFLVWIILASSLSSVLYFGYRCYHWVSELIGKSTNLFPASKSLQNQLFYALLAQSAFPLFLMYLPTGIVFIFPMLNIQLNINYGFVGLTIAVYPAIDPFPTILIIKKYREGFFVVLRRIILCRKISESTSQQATVNPWNVVSSVC